jgi:hypothetical protein
VHHQNKKCCKTDKLIGRRECCNHERMVQSRKAELEVKIEVDMPLDIIKDKERLKAVENGLVQSIYDGLYRRGVSFRVNKIHFKIK